MTPETVINARYAHGEHPAGWSFPQQLLLVDLDGVTVAIWDGAQQLLRDGGINLQAPPSRPESTHYLIYKFLLPADPDNGRLDRRMFDGATGDPRVMALTRKYLYDLETDQWRPGARIG